MSILCTILDAWFIHVAKMSSLVRHDKTTRTLCSVFLFVPGRFDNVTAFSYWIMKVGNTQAHFLKH